MMKTSLIILFSIVTLLVSSQETARKIGLNIGDIAPNISLPNPQGDTLNLFDLRGQVVLIDFWASWCGPCRRENPNVVYNYKKYTEQEFTIGKGFTVYSVSLDQDKGSWVKTINKDNLTWENHVTDFLGWRSPYVSLYQITGIPMNYLIDENGVIIAKNIRGDSLEHMLKRYVAKKR